MCTCNRCRHIDTFHFISRVNQDIHNSNTYTMLDLAMRPHNHSEILCQCLATLVWDIPHLNRVILMLQGTPSQVTLRLMHQQGIHNPAQATLNLAQGTLNLAQDTHQQGIPSQVVLKGIHKQILLKVILNHILLNLLKRGILSHSTRSKIKGTRSLAKGTLLASTKGTLQVGHKPKARHTMYLRDIFPR